MAVHRDNLTLVLKQKLDFSLEQRPIPTPKQNEVLVAVQAVGICGSDIHKWLHGTMGDFVVKFPFVLGHEASGTIVEVGEGVQNLKLGDRVAMEVGVSCNLCEFCKRGTYNLCPEMKYASSIPIDGTLTRHYVCRADLCYKIPDHVTFEEGAMLEPLSVVISACRRGRVTMGENILIMGAGSIGLLTLLTTKALGVNKVCITDTNPKRLEFAQNMGADFTVLSDSKETPDNMVKKVHDLLGGAPNVTVDCCGAESCIRLGILATKSGGRLVLVGIGAKEVTIPLLNAAVREVDIIGILRFCNTYPTALGLVSSGKVDVKPLITHRFTLEQSIEAFQVAQKREEGSIKVMIDCSKK